MKNLGLQWELGRGGEAWAKLELGVFKQTWEEACSCFYVIDTSIELLQYQGREGNGTPLQFSCLKNLMDGGTCPWGREEQDTTERLHFHFSLSCIGEGNGNPLQCSCLENPRNGGAWWTAVYGVAQSQTWLKQVSSSSSSCIKETLWADYVRSYRKHMRRRFNPWLEKTPWRRAWQPTPVFLPGESHGQKSLAGYNLSESQRVRHDWSDITHTKSTKLYIHHECKS